MDFLWKFILCFTVILSNLGVLQCLNLQLYQRKDFVGLQRDFKYKVEDETVCVTFKNGSVDVGSVKTDKCVILYVNKHCTTPKSVLTIGRSSPAEWSRRFDRDTAEIPSHQSRLRLPYSSFHVCSQGHGGGPQLDMDIYNRPQPGNSLIMKYRGVCNCRNIPAAVRMNPNIYVDMHGNKVDMYSEENCEGTSYQLGPQDNVDNRFVQDTIQFQPKSFKPVGLENCYKLHADIHKFHFRDGLEEMGEEAPKTTKIRLDDATFMLNRGSTDDIQTFNLSTRIPEKVFFEISGPITKLESAVVIPDFEISAEAKLRMMKNSDIKPQLNKTFKWSKGPGSKIINTTILTSSDRVASSSLPVIVPACSYCTLIPYVESLKDVVVLYDIYSYIRGSDPADNLTAEEIRQNLPPGMTYIRDHDNHTVEALSHGKMFGELAFEVVISKGCVPTQACARADLKGAASSKHEYKLPISVSQGELLVG